MAVCALPGRCAVTLAAALLSLAGCTLNVDYSGSRFACEPPDGLCPPGFECRADGVCVAPNGGGADAAIVDANTDPDAPFQPGIDAGIDAPLPDAGGGGVVVTATFGERPTSDFQGVTFDTFLDSFDTNTNFGGQTAFICASGGNGVAQKTGLLRFDLSSIPTGATVMVATLQLGTGGNPLDANNGAQAQFRVVTEESTEGNVTNGSAGVANFNQRKQGTSWGTAGAKPPNSASSPVVATVDATDVDTDYDIALPPAVVQTWVAFPLANFGLACTVIVDPGSDSDGDFKASESAQSSRRPQLTITYRTP